MNITTSIPVFCVRNVFLNQASLTERLRGEIRGKKKGLFSEMTFQVRTEASYTVANELLDL